MGNVTTGDTDFWQFGSESVRGIVPPRSFLFFGVSKVDIIKGLREYGRLVGRGDVPPLNPIDESGTVLILLGVGKPKTDREKAERIERLKTFYNPPE